MTRHLSEYEKETVITFNESKDLAEIYTLNKRWQKHLEEMGLKPIKDNGFGGRTYQIDKKRIPLPRAPRKARVLTAEEKKSIGNRLHNARLASQTIDTAMFKTKRKAKQ